MLVLSAMKNILVPVLCATSTERWIDATMWWGRCTLEVGLLTRETLRDVCTLPSGQDPLRLYARFRNSYIGGTKAIALFFSTKAIKVAVVL